MATNKKKEDYAIEEQSKLLTTDDYSKFADIYSHEKTQSLISKTLSQSFISIIKYDHETRKELKAIIKEVENENLMFQIKNIWNAIKSILLIALGAIITILIEKYLK